MLENNIKNLIKILEESNVDELEISTSWNKQRIRIRKNASSKLEKNISYDQETIISPINNTPESTEIIKSEQEDNESASSKINEVTLEEETTKEDNEETVIIKAPLVGTYYTSSKPDAAPFLTEGDIITKGQVICIIEAMKIFNEIESEISGKVVKLLIKNGTPVEYDQDLIVVVPE